RGVEDDRGSSLGARFADAALEGALGDVLDGEVDGELHRRALHLLWLLDAVGQDLAAARVALDLEAPRLGAEVVLVVALDAPPPLEIDAGEAEHVRGGRLVRIEP